MDDRVRAPPSTDRAARSVDGGTNRFALMTDSAELSSATIERAAEFITDWSRFSWHDRMALP